MTAESRDNDCQTTPRSSVGWMLVWLVIGVIVAYFSLFALICIDELVMHRKMILEPMRRSAPQLAEQFIDACRTIYSPLIALMKATRLVPP